MEVNVISLTTIVMPWIAMMVMMVSSFTLMVITEVLTATSLHK
jgi:hypothetical protein